MTIVINNPPLEKRLKGLAKRQFARTSMRAMAESILDRCIGDGRGGPINQWVANADALRTKLGVDALLEQESGKEKVDNRPADSSSPLNSQLSTSLPPTSPAPNPADAPPAAA